MRETPGAPTHPFDLCICVDDFGLHDGINAAVLDLIGQGRVHATACMVGAPACKTGAALLRGLQAPVDVGLHLDMTEFPLLPGSRRSLRGLIAGSIGGWLNPTMIRAEIRAQLNAFEDTFGHAPAFVDGHQHVHQLSGIRQELVMELCQRYATTRRPWLRSTRQRALTTGRRVRFKSAVIDVLGASALRDLAQKTGFAQNAGLLGVYDFKGGPPRYRALLAAWLNAARPGDLLMCHASTGSHPDEPLDLARQAEHAVLSEPRVADLLAERGLALRRMSEILRHGHHALIPSER